MNKYLPTTHEIRSAFFTAIALLIVLAVLGIVGKLLKVAVFGFSDGGYGMHNNMSWSRNEKGMGKMMMWRGNEHADMDMSEMNMDDMMMDMSASLEGLTGDELDKAFLQEMIVHHEGAIDMARILKEGTKRPELIKMANDIINAQAKEVAQMETWLDTWFPTEK